MLFDLGFKFYEFQQPFMEEYAPDTAEFLALYLLQITQEILVGYMTTVFIFSELSTVLLFEHRIYIITSTFFTVSSLKLTLQPYIDYFYIVSNLQRETLSLDLCFYFSEQSACLHSNNLVFLRQGFHCR